MRLRPLHDWVLVERTEAEERTAGGIIIPSSAKEKPSEGIVRAIGPGTYKKEKGKKEKKFIPTVLKPGERIVFVDYKARDIDFDGREITLIREEDVLGIYEDTVHAVRHSGAGEGLPSVTEERKVPAVRIAPEPKAAAAKKKKPAARKTTAAAPKKTAARKTKAKKAATAGKTVKKPVVKKKTSKKATPKKTAVKKTKSKKATVARKTARKPAVKTAAKKTAARKKATKKAVKKSVSKRPVGKKTVKKTVSKVRKRKKK